MKHDELQTCHDHIAGKDSRINEVRKTFQKELKRVSEKKIRVSFDHEDVLRDQNELLQQCERFKESRKERTKKEEVFVQVVELVSQEIKVQDLLRNCRQSPLTISLT